MDKTRKRLLGIVGVIILVLILAFFTNKKVIYRYMPNSKVNETVKKMKESSKELASGDGASLDKDFSDAEAGGADMSSDVDASDDSDMGATTEMPADSSENPYNQKYDYDLTANDADMNYVIVAMIAEDPKSFEGVRIKLKGVAMDMPTTDTSGIDHYVVINDRQACCQQGLQYVLKDKDQKYAKDGEEVTVEGELTVFNSPDIPFPLAQIVNARIITN